MSVEAAIITYLEDKIEALLGAPVASKHFYDFNKNDGANNDFIYAVRPGPANSIEGTVGRASFQQEFEIQIAREYQELGEDDLSLREAIEFIRSKFDLLLASVVGKPSGNIRNILTPSFSAPEVNEAQKSVSITYTFPIIYFVSTRGA